MFQKYLQEIMYPVIAHIRNIFPELSLPAVQKSIQWTFDENIKKLGPDFYSKVIPFHQVLNMEYSMLCHQIRHNFTFPDQISKEQMIEQVTAALILAELMAHVYQHYLIVPREVSRLRRQQQVYRDMLSVMADYKFNPIYSKCAPVDLELSLTQRIRENTAWINWYRLLLTRSKRVLNFLDLLGTGSEQFSKFVKLMDRYTNPFFAYIAWCFFIPRLVTNLFLIAKHIIPGPWMDDNEKALEWYLRLQAQIQRRWFELGNDAVWITVGLINCFVLIGTLGPFAIYLSLFAFAFDVAYASLRAYIELNRLYTLKEEYELMYRDAGSEEERKAIRDYQMFLAYRINFEKLRLTLNLVAAVAIFLAMCLAIPALAVNPVIPLIGAILLILIWITTFVLTQKLEQYRPNDTVEKPDGVTKFGIFARKPEDKSKLAEPLPLNLSQNDDFNSDDLLVPSMS